MPSAHLRTSQRHATQASADALEPRTPPELVDARVINPRSGFPWPKWNNTDDVLLYLKRVHGLSPSKQTLAHHRSKGIGIRWSWYGQVPVTTLEEVDRYVREDALKPNSPLVWRPDQRRSQPPRGGKRGRPPGRKRQSAAAVGHHEPPADPR
jgi:hypothetical protein